jgi:hypothetical protein
LANELRDAITENLNYVDGVDNILGKFYYLSDPDQLRQAVEHWLTQTPEGRAWLESLGFINKEAVVKVIEQIETNLQQSNQDLVGKIQMLKSYMNGSDESAESSDSHGN